MYKPIISSFDLSWTLIFPNYRPRKYAIQLENGKTSVIYKWAVISRIHSANLELIIFEMVLTSAFISFNRPFIAGIIYVPVTC